MSDTTPNIFEYYRKLRPEQFSDSYRRPTYALAKEILEYQLDKISTDMKQDQFEVLCRRLVEKTITPNLIPQTGPTGGGDGKTDFETYPVSNDISTKWYVSGGGCSGDEKWAFAISSKKDWSSKVSSDVKHIVETQRGYTRIYFISNQSISSKKRKDKEDALKGEYGVDVVILNMDWITSTIYEKNYINIAVESLGLSDQFKSNEVVLGANDAKITKDLEVLELQIAEWEPTAVLDTQHVDNLLEAAILSRSLERSKDEVIGKFDRALRVCKTNGSRQQEYNIIYAKAYTCFYWFQDPIEMLNGYEILKEKLLDGLNVNRLADLFTLQILVDVSTKSGYISIDFDQEKEFVNSLYAKLKDDQNYKSSALFIKFHIVYSNLLEAIKLDDDIDDIIIELDEIIREANYHIDIPFEILYRYIELVGCAVDLNDNYDNLLGNIALTLSQRNSELSSAQIYYNRGIQNVKSGNNEAAIKNLGCCLMSLQKNESIDMLQKAYWALGSAYQDLDLLYSSNVCFAKVCALFIRDYYRTGECSCLLLYSLVELCKNEIQLGRITMFLCWYEFLNILACNTRTEFDNEATERLSYLDSLLSVRLAYTEHKVEEYCTLPDTLIRLGLNISANVVLMMLGYEELIDKEFKDLLVNPNGDNWLQIIKNQPLAQQLLCDTNLYNDNNVTLNSLIGGCSFKVVFDNSSSELMSIAEVVLAMLESLFSTLSFLEIVPTVSSIDIQIEKIQGDDMQATDIIDKNNGLFIVQVGANSGMMANKLCELVVVISAKYFMSTKPMTELFTSLADKEKLFDRLLFCVDYNISIRNILGDNYKYKIQDWTLGNTKEYKCKKISNTTLKEAKFKSDASNSIFKGVINNDLWDKAKWVGFGFARDLYQPNLPPMIMLAYDNFEYGNKIFEDWSKRQSNNNLPIRLSIIKEVDSNNPYWYKVHITTDFESIQEKDRFVVTHSRCHLMTPDTPDNLNQIISLFRTSRNIQVIPVRLTKDNKWKVDKTCNSIIIDKIIIRDASDVAPERDIDCIAL